MKFKLFNDKQKDKLSNFVIDVAKYILTAILIAAFFSKQDNWGPQLVVGSIVVVVALLSLGIALSNQPKNK